MNTDVIDQEDFSMPQMFDWIFFAIVLPVPVLLVWDWYRQGNGNPLKAVQGRGQPDAQQ